MRSLKQTSTLNRLFCLFLSLMPVAACTPEYARTQGEDFAAQARLLDSVDIDRQNHRLLSRQSQVCLMSGDGGEEQGADLLRTIQDGFAGYFVSVAVLGESIDYLRALASTPCPGATYLLYVQAPGRSSCENGQSSCRGATSHYVITVVSAEEHTLVDRIKFSIKNSFLPIGVGERERRQKGFEQLAILLTGSK